MAELIAFGEREQSNTVEEAWQAGFGGYFGSRVEELMD